MMHGFSMTWGGFLVMILVWVLLIAAAVGLVKLLFSGGNQQSLKDFPREETALDIASRRYANGELTREEYKIIKRDLAGS